MAIYRVANDLFTGANDGSDWPNAFRSIDDLTGALNIDAYDRIYIKATNIPYREYLGNGKFNNKIVYGDALGVGLLRGVTKSEFWGSVDATSFTWVQEGSSTVYRADGINLISPGRRGPAVNTAVTVGWHYISPTSISELTGYGAGLPSQIIDLPLNQVCYDNINLQVWVNIGENPTGKHLELIYLDHPLEIWTSENLYGVVGKHGIYGLANGGCSGWIIDGVELLFNHIGALPVNRVTTLPSYFRNSEIHHNTLHGVGGANEGVNLYFQKNLVYANGGCGFNLAYSNVIAHPGHLEHNTIYGNNNYGIKIDNSIMSEYWKIKNNISVDNAYAQFYLYNGAGGVLEASNNCPGIVNMYGGDWAAYKGFGNVEGDPLMIGAENADFRLRSTSPCIGTAIDVGLGTMNIGAKEYQEAIDRERIKAIISQGFLGYPGRIRVPQNGVKPLGVKQEVE
jgi:hypothetical protein